MSRRRILIVDDEVALAETISDYLEGAGYRCKTATSASEAIQLLGGGGFDVVLTDICLSGGGDASGLDVAAHVRNASLPIHVLIMTAHDTPHYESEAARLAAPFLRKPIALAHLAREIDQLGQDE